MYTEKEALLYDDYKEDCRKLDAWKKHQELEKNLNCKCLPGWQFREDFEDSIEELRLDLRYTYAKLQVLRKELYDFLYRPTAERLSAHLDDHILISEKN